MREVSNEIALMKVPLSSRTVKLEASALAIRLVIDEITNTANIDSDN